MKQLQSFQIHKKIQNIENEFKTQTCTNIPNVVWERKQHIVSLPYEQSFNERIFLQKRGLVR